MAQAPRSPLPTAVSGLVIMIRALFPCWPRVEPVKLTVAPLLRVRLARVRSIELKVPPPAVAVMVLAPCRALTAPRLSTAAVSTRPVTEIVPPRRLIASASAMRSLFWVWRLLLLLKLRVA